MGELRRFLVFLTVSGVLLFISGVGDSRALEDSVRRLDPTVIRFCVNQLLFDHTFPDGTPAGKRTIIDPNSAALACRGVISKQEARTVRQCVNGLLYEETFSNGNPAGDRTILDPASAARACALCKDRS